METLKDFLDQEYRLRFRPSPSEIDGKREILEEQFPYPKDASALRIELQDWIDEEIDKRLLAYSKEYHPDFSD